MQLKPDAPHSARVGDSYSFGLYRRAIAVPNLSGSGLWAPFRLKEWHYLTDTNDWFLADSRLRKQSVFWMDRIPIEFAYAQDLDTMVAKWRGYMRYVVWFRDWRWVMGHQVS